MSLDLRLIGRIVERETMRDLELGTWQALVNRVKLSRSTINRVRRGERVDEKRYAKIESALGMPTDTLRTIGLHDVQGLRDLGVSADIISTVERFISDTPAEGKETVKRRRTGM